MRSLSQVCLAIALVATLLADAHGLRAQIRGNQALEPDSFRQVASDIDVGLPGRLWFRSTYADEGLGYEGAYLTLGGKRQIYEDSWDGRWLAEGRFHYGLEEDGFFANLGIERVFSLDAIGADLVGGFWYDYDGDQQGNFAHDFSQVSINAAIKTRKWDLIGNGYFPVGVTDFTTGGPDGSNVFLGNSILITPGIDSALRGFDVTLRMRPKHLAFGNGIIDFGGYGYSSDTIDFFSGGRARLGFQAQNGASVIAEVNHDDRFGTTGSLGVAWAFGRRGAAGGSGGIGNDLAETVRGDHIVRFNQGFEVAVDPATGLAFNVLHVNNTSDPAFEDGTAETPFASLAAAEAFSVEGDVIFVSPGDGSRQGLNTGFVLKDGQQFLGSGGQNIIQIQGGRNFLIPGTGPRPVISNPGADSVITLANDNTIRNVNIDGTATVNGIIGEGVSNGTIEDTNVSLAGENGVFLDQISGDWNFRRNSFSNNNIDGLFISNTTDNQSVFTLEDNIANGNGFNGIHFENFRAESLNLVNNTTSDNARHGLFIEEFVGAGLDVDIINHTASNNGGTGILLDQGDGNLNILNTTALDNGINGIQVSDWSNTQSGDRTLISITEGGLSNIGGNRTSNIFVQLTDANLVQDVLITDISTFGGGRGVFASAGGIGSVLNVQVVENVEFSQHLTDGLRFEATNSGTLNVLVENTEDFPLVLNDNGDSGGAGVAFFADAPLGQPVSRINAIVRNVSINNDNENGFVSPVIGAIGAFGVTVDGTGTSRINLQVEESRIESPGGINVDIDNNGNGDVNNIFFRDVVIRSDFAVNVDSRGGTVLDFALLNSNIQSNGLIRADGFDPFLGPTTSDANDQAEVGDPFLDTVGTFGFFATIDGDFGGDFDNLTRIQLSNNVIRDFTFDAVTINTTGDAQLLAYLTSNEILQNGPGIDNEIEFPDNPATNGTDFVTVNPNELNFFSGVVINSFGTSRISLRTDANSIVNNFELGLQLNTFNSSTINASINFNNFANDIGQDADATMVGVLTSFLEDFQANNTGNASMCLDLSTNAFRSAANFNQTSTNPFLVELDGATNGFTSDTLGVGVTTGSVGVCEGLISDEELFFTAAGFVDADTPPGGGFSPLDH